MKDFYFSSLRTLRQGLDRRAFSARELVSGFLSRIGERNGLIGAFPTCFPEFALSRAKEADERIRRGEAGLFTGIPYGLKDNLCTAGLATGCASKMLAGYIPPYDSRVYDQLSREGAVLLGKTNMDEFSMGSSTETSVYGPTKNPLDPSRVPGGSSGGSAAAVADGECVFAIGTDTGGSIRQPAAFCGIYGMKPTYGLVSRRGLIAYAASMDQAGPMTRTLWDNAALLSVLASHDPSDATCKPREMTDYTAGWTESLSGMTFAVPDCVWGFCPSVDRMLEDACRRLSTLGMVQKKISREAFSLIPYCYHILSRAEASSELARYDGIRFGHRTEDAADPDTLYRRSRSEGFGKEVSLRILLGTCVLTGKWKETYWRPAFEGRKVIRAAFARSFSAADVLLFPSAPGEAFTFGQEPDGDREALCCAGANLAGLPALSIPFGAGESGLPLGLSLVGDAFSEALLYRIAAQMTDSEGIA